MLKFFFMKIFVETKWDVKVQPEPDGFRALSPWGQSDRAWGRTCHFINNFDSHFLQCQHSQDSIKTWVLAAGLYKFVFVAAKGSVCTFHTSLIKRLSLSFWGQNKLFSCDFVQQGDEEHMRSSCNSVVIRRDAQTRCGLEEGAASPPAQPLETGETPMSPRAETDTPQQWDSLSASQPPPRRMFHTGEPDTGPTAIYIPKNWKTCVRHVPVLKGRAARKTLLRLFGRERRSIVGQIIWLSWVRVCYTKTSCKERAEDEFQTLTLDNKQNLLFSPCFREEGEGSSSTLGWVWAVDQAEPWHRWTICRHCRLFLVQ